MQEKTKFRRIILDLFDGSDAGAAEGTGDGGSTSAVDHAAAQRGRELGLDDDTVLVGCVGRLTYQKNQSFLLEVMREAADLEPDEDCRLILIGDGEDRSMLEGKAADLDIREKVIFTGAVSNVQDYLQAVDVAVMPSRYEGLAIAVIEEQASGLEILVSEAIPESAAVTDCVVFLPAGDKHKWAQAIMRKHSRHPEQADQVAANGYSIKETASVVRRLYAE